MDRYNISMFPLGSQEWVGEFFQAFEFDCESDESENRFTLIAPSLVYILDEIRRRVGRPIRIESGYRTFAWNKEIGGKEGSWHLRGMAADIWAPGMDINALGMNASYLLDKGVEWMGNTYQIGGYREYLTNNFIHLDVRPRKTDGGYTTW